MRIEVKNLPARMHAGVGSSAAGNVDRPLKNLSEPLLDHRLHRHGVGLNLPARERRPIVGDGALPAGDIVRVFNHKISRDNQGRDAMGYSICAHLA